MLVSDGQMIVEVIAFGRQSCYRIDEEWFEKEHLFVVLASDRYTDVE